MARYPKPTILQDISRFAEIGAYLSESNPPSLNRIAQKMGISPPTIQAVLQRLESHLNGVSLVHTGKGSGTASILTPEGQEYLQEAQKLLHWRPGGGSEIRLALSHSLLTSRILSSVLYEFQRRTRRRIRIETATVMMDFHQVIRDLQTGRLDLGIVWSNEGRYKKEDGYPGVISGEFAHQFDVVFISRNVGFLPDDDNDYSKLSRLRVVTLRPEGLAKKIKDSLPSPNGAFGGERVFADTYDAVISCVLSGVCDVGVVVANYFDLEVLGHENKIFYSKPIEKSRLMWLKRLEKNNGSSELIVGIDMHFRNKSYVKSAIDAIVVEKFPENPSFYVNFKYGYYIDCQGPLEDIVSADGPSRWNWERLCLEENRQMQPPISFRGIAINSSGHKYFIRARANAGLFRINAKFISEGGSKNNDFFSVFNSYVKYRDNHILYGVWTGITLSGRHPSLYGAILSWEPLTFQELRAIAQTLRARTSLDAEAGLNFDGQIREPLTIPDGWYDKVSP